jgi:glycerol-3-phosphate acyltransferase PlsX
MSELKKIYKSNFLTKLSALIVKKRILEFSMNMNPDSVGGAIMLGISKPVIKAHGSSNAIAIYNAIHQAMIAVTADMASHLKANMNQMKITEECS